MIKQHSWTRREYEAALRELRQGSTVEWLEADETYSAEVIKAADYSYQAKGYNVHAWSNDGRHERFHAIKYRASGFPEDIPF